MSTGLVWHELYMWHQAGRQAGKNQPGLTIQPGTPFEDAETKRRFKNLLDVSGMTDELVPIRARELSREELETVHTPDYLDKVKSFSDGDGSWYFDGAAIGTGSYEIAALSAGGVVEAVEAVMQGKVSNAYALVRPPGHHAEPDMGRGFCLMANGALAVRHALKKYGLERIAIIDWDVHHGNGAQRIFWESPEVLTISIHQDRNFPLDSGLVDELGAGAGAGYNVNIPMLPGCGHGAYVEAMETIIAPLVRDYKPQMILVSCGFDAGALDPLGRMLLHSDSFRYLTQSVMDLADEFCQGRLVLCHEGGYEPHSVPYMGLAVMETLLGKRTAIADPDLVHITPKFGQELQPFQREHIRQLREQLIAATSGGPCQALTA